MAITTIQTAVCRILAEQLCRDEQEITPDSTLDSLGADSLDKVEILMTLEDQFDIEIADWDFADIETVQQAIELVQRLRDDH